MAISNSPWRALKPFLIAGAAALTWLTLSASGAVADPLDPVSPVGHASSEIASIVTEPVAAVPTIPTAPTFAAPVAALAETLSPAIHSSQGAIDSRVSSVPVLDQVVPAGTVAAITIPAFEIAGGVAPAVTGILPPAVTGILPPAVTGILPPAIPGVVAPMEEASPVPAPDSQPAPDAVSSNGVMPSPSPAAGPDDLEHPGNGALVGASALAAAGVSTPASAGIPARNVANVSGPGPNGAVPELAGAATGPSDGERGPALPLPAPVPPGTSAGAGSGSSLAGFSSIPAWTNASGFHFEPCGTGSAGDSDLLPLTLVSFDPGSSPD